MNNAVEEAKSALRTEIRARLKLLTPATRTADSEALCQRLRALPIWTSAKSVLLFAPHGSEPDIWPLLADALQSGKVVALPAFHPGTNNYVARRIVQPERDVVSGKFGIREGAEFCEEISLNQLDLVLVPGVAFDSLGRRLGRGKGFYDRMLASVRGSKCGVAFDVQIVEVVPVGPLDIPLNCIVTPTRWIET